MQYMITSLKQMVRINNPPSCCNGWLGYSRKDLKMYECGKPTQPGVWYSKINQQNWEQSATNILNIRDGVGLLCATLTWGNSAPLHGSSLELPGWGWDSWTATVVWLLNCILSFRFHGGSLEIFAKIDRTWNRTSHRSIYLWFISEV